MAIRVSAKRILPMVMPLARVHTSLSRSTFHQRINTLQLQTQETLRSPEEGGKFEFSPKQAVDLRPGVTAQNANWLYCERFLNGIAPRRNNPLATYTEVAPEFRPGSNESSIPLPLFELPREKINVLASPNVDPKLVQRYLPKDKALFAVFPQIAKDTAVPHIPDITAHPAMEADVAPTASSRSLYVLDDALPSHCVKTHLPLRITRAFRSLTWEKIQHSIHVSGLLEASAEVNKLKETAYMPETLGVAYKGEGSWGFLVREMIPRPYVDSSRKMLPLFSLYAKDQQHPDEQPILIQKIKAAGEDPKKFVLERIMYPLIKSWADIYLHTGVMVEAHGQNTCFELDDKGMPARVVFRDFDTYVSKDLCEENGFSTEKMNQFKVSKASPENGQNLRTSSVLSTIYDQSMRTPLDRLAQLCEEHFKIPQTEMQEACKAYLRQVLPEADLHFPKDGQVFNFQQGAIRLGQKPEIVLTQDKPVWR